MKATIISYDPNKKSPAQRRKLYRLLYGYTDYSNNNQYKYKRKGVLDFWTYIRLEKSSLLVPEKTKVRVIKALKGNNFPFQEIPVEIDRNTFKKLLTPEEYKKFLHKE
ncbi:MAG: hypothetical protein ACI83O_000576 [Patescibacteria group bacterium]|jgi:hypothetical protein